MEPVQNEDQNDSITLQCFVSAVEQQQANLSQHIIDTFGSTMANMTAILADTIKNCFQEGSKNLNRERANEQEQTSDIEPTTSNDKKREKEGRSCSTT